MKHNSKLSVYKLKKIIKCFCIDIDAMRTALLLELNRNTINHYGGLGNDYVEAKQGDDYIDGRDSEDKLYGQDGNITLKNFAHGEYYYIEQFEFTDKVVSLFG